MSEINGKPVNQSLKRLNNSFSDATKTTKEMNREVVATTKEIIKLKKEVSQAHSFTDFVNRLKTVTERFTEFKQELNAVERAFKTVKITSGKLNTALIDSTQALKHFTHSLKNTHNTQNLPATVQKQGSISSPFEGLTGIIQSGFNASKSLNNIRISLNAFDKDNPVIAQLKAQAQTLSLSRGVGFKDVIDAQNKLLTQGYAVEKVLAIMPDVVNYARVKDITPSASADTVARYKENYSAKNYDQFSKSNDNLAVNSLNSLDGQVAVIKTQLELISFYLLESETIKGLLDGVIFFLDAVLKLTIKFPNVMAALFLLGGGLTFFGGKIIRLSKKLRKFGKSISDLSKKGLSFLKEGGKKLVDFTKKYASKTKNAVSKKFTQSVEKTKKIAGNIKEKGKGAINSSKNIATKTKGIAVGWVDKFKNKIGAVTTNIGKNTKNIFPKASRVLNTIKPAITTATSTTLTTTSNVASKLGSMFKGLASSAMNIAKGPLGKAALNVGKVAFTAARLTTPFGIAATLLTTFGPMAYNAYKKNSEKKEKEKKEKEEKNQENVNYEKIALAVKDNIPPKIIPLSSDTNNYEITINTLPGMDEKTVADIVMGKIKQHQEEMNRVKLLSLGDVY